MKRLQRLGVGMGSLLTCASCAPEHPAPSPLAGAGPDALMFAAVRPLDGAFAEAAAEEWRRPLFWADSGLEASFTGATRLSVRVAPGPQRREEDGQATLRLDGGPPLLLSPAGGGVTLDGLDADLEHTLRVHKRTEPYLGALVVSELQLSCGGRFLPPPPSPARQLEFVGDSVTLSLIHI